MSVVDVTFPGNIPQVASAAALRNVPSSYIVSDALYYVPALTAIFRWDPSSLANDDGVTVIRPNDISGHSGRWLVGLGSGSQGPAATVSVNSTTTLPPGSPATVTNIGTSSAAQFVFGIPQGETGGSGDTGITLRSKVRAATKPTERTPSIADDSAQGYAVGDLWGVEDGKLYMCSTAQAGKAVWAVNDLSNMPMGKNLLPLDRITGASLAIAPWKLRAAYVGNCFQVQRDSDSTTLDIGFVWDSVRKVYVADWEACDKFIEGTANAWYTILYDQSGNGYNLTATSFKVYIISSAIGTTTRNDINGLRVFTFWGAPSQMAIPIGHSVSRQNCTVISAGCVAASGHGNAICELGNDASYLNRLLLTTVVRDGRVQPIGNVNLVGTRAESSPHVIGAGFGSGVSDYMCNDDTATTGGLGAFTLTGGFVGSANGGGYTYWGDYAALIVYPTKRTTAEMQTLRQMISRVMRLRPQARDRLILVGDSITVGADASVQPWWRQTLPMFNRDFKVFNNSLEGDTAVAAIASVATQVTSSVKAGVTNVVVYAYGTNDLAALAPANGDAVNAATVQGRIQAHCAAIRAANSTTKIVVCTILPRNNSFTGGQTVTSFEASRLLINTWIRANYTTFADAIADYGGDPFVGQLANVTDGTWMNGNLHPKARGHAYMGAYVAAAVNGLG